MASQAAHAWMPVLAAVPSGAIAGIWFWSIPQELLFLVFLAGVATPARVAWWQARRGELRPPSAAVAGFTAGLVLFVLGFWWTFTPDESCVGDCWDFLIAPLAALALIPTTAGLCAWAASRGIRTAPRRMPDLPPPEP